MLREGPTDNKNGSVGTASINLKLTLATKFCFCLHHYGDNSCLFINGKKIKADNVPFIL